jgi:hypothetical protein
MPPDVADRQEWWWLAQLLAIADESVKEQKRKADKHEREMKQRG